MGLVSQAGHGAWQLTRPADQPLVAAGPAEPVSVAYVIADPVPAAVTAVTTESANCDDLDGLRELIDERAAFLEFDAGMDRESAESRAFEILFEFSLSAGRAGDVHQHMAAPNCMVQRPAQAVQPAPPVDPHRLPIPHQGDLWSNAQLRQLNPWCG